ncbi:DUF6053 domain-containing protein [Lysobacter enzymogenes]|uniref:DUF6053 domain-containing protein n=1 Tax=Lysobacter enzymogenes TaxID=69 RepID=UPI003D18C810
MGGASAPTLSCRIAASGPESVGAEAPPTKALSPWAFTPVAPPATCPRVESGALPHPVASFR